MHVHGPLHRGWGWGTEAVALESEATLTAPADPYLSLLQSETDRERFETLLRTLAGWQGLFAGKRVLDFGASVGISLIALLRLGAVEVIGVEPDRGRVDRGQDLLARAAPGAKASLIHVPNTRHLPFADGEFGFVLVNAVMEHIPQPRQDYVRELWRLVSSGGVLMVNETPNKYFPKEIHTTSLWFNHWLPREMAHRRAVRRGRFDARRTDWDSSGWRGLGYFELVNPISGYRLIPERGRLRHRLLTMVGVPASVFDPYPTWILQKHAGSHTT